VRRLLFIALLVVSPAILHAETTVSGNRVPVQRPAKIITLSTEDTLIVEAGKTIQGAFYRVYGTMIVNHGASLLNCRFEIYGNLITKGTETDSVIISEGRGVRFFGGQGHLSYTRVSDCIADPGFPYNRRYVEGGGIHVSGAEADVQMVHCVIERNVAENIKTESGSVFIYGRGGGVAVRDSARLEMSHCRLSGNRTRGWGCAAYASGQAQLTLKRCLIMGNRFAQRVGYTSEGGVVSLWSGAIAEIRNCTITGNEIGWTNIVHRVSGSVVVVNSILWQAAGRISTSGEGTAIVNHSIMQYEFPGEGNIIADPLFLDSAGGDFHIAYNSPALNAGDPAYGLDIDGTLPDLGAFPYIRPYPMSASESDDRPLAFALHPNMPNPFNPSTRLRYDLPASSPVRVDIYNAAGQRVRRLVDGYRSAGRHTAVWDGSDVYGRPVASGVYVYRLTSEHDIATRRMLLVR
jgi:hypothetical protein